MAPLNSEIRDMMWSEEDSKKEILRDFLNVGKQSLKKIYEGTDVVTLTELALRKEISKIMKKEIPITFEKEIENDMVEITDHLIPVYFEIVERAPGVYSLEQIVSTPIDEFEFLWGEGIEFARFYGSCFEEEERLKNIYADLTSEGELCAKDETNYYFLLDPKFDSNSPAIEKIHYILDSIKDEKEEILDEDLD